MQITVHFLIPLEILTTFGTKSTQDIEAMKSNRRVRDAVEAGIWPLNNNWLFGTYKYLCRILKPAPKMPDLGKFWQPFIKAIGSGSGEKIEY